MKRSKFTIGGIEYLYETSGLEDFLEEELAKYGVGLNAVLGDGDSRAPNEFRTWTHGNEQFKEITVRGRAAPSKPVIVHYFTKIIKYSMR